MYKGIDIKRAPEGYTRITYNGTEIARHNLSATTSGTREAFGIREEETIHDWFAKNYAAEMATIDEENE